MQISGLSASNTFSATDVLAIEVNENGTNKTYKLTGATLATALASIGSYLKTTDVVDNLTSTSTTAPLSAAQGKALNDTLPYTPFLTKQVDIGADVAMLEAGVYLFDGLATDYVNLPDQYANNSIIVVLYAARNRKNYICISHNAHKMYFGLQWGTNITWYAT